MIFGNKTNELNFGGVTSVAIGTFDGIHKGHRAVISAAAESGLPSMALIVNRPAEKTVSAPLLTSPDMREKTIKSLGIDYVLEFDFEQICEMSPQDFVLKILDAKIHAKKIFCGFNFRFGKNAAGDTKLLDSLCQECGMTLAVTPAIYEGGEPISSSRIRRAIEKGYVDTAARMLGRPFGFDFEVVDGDHLGRKLGAPTINQPIPYGYVVPKYGVYAAMAIINGKEHAAVCNVGERPTVRKTHVQAETYIIGFSGNLYGENIEVRLYKFLRPETKFPSLDALKAAIANDAKTAERFIEELR